MIELDSTYIQSIVGNALTEDVGSGDITTLLTTPVNYDATATMLAKEEGVIAGIELARAAFRIVDPSIIFDPCKCDGARVKPGDPCARPRVVWLKFQRVHAAHQAPVCPRA